MDMNIFREKNVLLLAVPAFIAGNLVLPVGATAAFKLPDTGQTLCYNTTSNEPDSCPNTGQDGEFAINPISYTKNLNSTCTNSDSTKCTVTDNNTGLMWQLNGSFSKVSWYQANGTYQEYSNPTSKNICGELTLDGFQDWRLPTRKELLSIEDYSMPGDNYLNTSYFSSTQPTYWSSTSAPASYLTSAWGINFNTGKTVSDTREYMNMSLRCVRGAQINQSFTNNNDGTITDNNTGLLWQQGEQGAKNWSVALADCNALTLGNYTDWRLPNVRELASIVADTRLNPALDTFYFPNVVSSGYWSSTSSASSTGSAWLVNFSNGSTDTGAKSSALNSRCVRGNSVSSQVPPVVTTTSISGITTTTATGGGNVTSGGSGAVSARGVCWGTAINPTTADSCISGGTGAGTFVTAITGLSPNKQYHVRAYATNTAWTTYGDDVSFTTSSLPPSVTTTALSAITQTSATAGGNVTSDGGAAVTVRGVCWGASVYPTTSDSHTTDSSGTGSFTSSITGLTPYNSYHVRAYATNTTGTSYGEDISFTTNLCAGDVQRGGVNYGTIQSAVSNGSGSEIKAVTRAFWEDLSFTNSSALTLNGGYACGLGSISGVTAVHGTMTISGSGAVALSNLAVY